MSDNSFWVITSFFNPAAYERRIRNYHAFRRSLELPLLVVELAEPGCHQLSAQDADRVVSLSGSTRIWQKERLLNLAVQALPQETKFVAWVDCDVVFGDPEWHERARDLLSQGKSWVQLFDQALHLPPHVHPESVNREACWNAHPILTEQSVAAALAEGTYPHGPERQIRAQVGETHSPSKAPPVAHGIAWAGHRKTFRDTGLYDRCVIGGGDTAMALAGMGKADILPRIRPMSEKQRDHYLRWAKRLSTNGNEPIGFVPGSLFHLWHGHMHLRQYVERHHVLKRLGFDPSRDLETAENGTFRWAPHAQALESAVSDYFFQRREDDVSGARAPAGSD